MTVFDVLLPTMVATARTHLLRGSTRANNLRNAILEDYNPAEWEDDESPNGRVRSDD